MNDDFQKGLRYYILEESEKACGCVALEKAGPDVCYLGRLAVLPEHPFFGPARKMYLSCGFIESERKREFVKQPVETIHLNLKVGQIPVTFKKNEHGEEILWMKQIEPALTAVS